MDHVESSVNLHFLVMANLVPTFAIITASLFRMRKNVCDEFPSRSPQLRFLILAHGVFPAVEPTDLERVDASCTSASRSRSSITSPGGPRVRSNNPCFFERVHLATQSDVDGGQQSEVLRRRGFERRLAGFNRVAGFGLGVGQGLDGKAGGMDEFRYILLLDCQRHERSHYLLL